MSTRASTNSRSDRRFRNSRGAALIASLGGQRHHRALRAPRDRARDVRERRAARARGQDEFGQPRQRRVVVRQRGVERGDGVVLEQRVAGDRQLAAEVEQLVLDRHQQVAHVVGQRLGQQHAEVRVELVDVAHRADAPVALGHARAVAESGGAVVAGAGRDLGESIGHGASLEPRRDGDRCARRRRLRRLPQPRTPPMNTAADFSPNVLPRPMPAAMIEALRARFGERFVTVAGGARAARPRRVAVRRAAAGGRGVLREHRGRRLRRRDRGRAPRAGDPVRRRLVAGRPPAGGAGRRQRRRVAHEPRAAARRRRPDRDRAGRRHAHAAQSRDQGFGAVLPDRPGRRRDARRHVGHARVGHQRRALRHDARERAGADGGHGQRRGDPHRHAGAQVERRLRPDAADGGQRGHAGRDHRGHAEAASAARERGRGHLLVRRRRRRRSTPSSRSSRWACRSRAAS